MRQAIHILRKDVRRSRIYISAVWSLVVANAVLTPRWERPGGESEFFLGWLHLLIGAAWWFTIAHLVHGERLVGERQFWVSRPYSWRSLLGSKLLFCVVFLCLPLLAADYAILVQEGFSPAVLWRSLLVRQCAVAGVYMMPPFVLAAITRNLRGFVLACAVLTIAFVLMIIVSTLHPQNQVADAVLGAHRGSREITLVAVGLAIILWQYASRRTVVARTAAIAFLLIEFASTALPPKAIARTAETPRHPEIRFAFAADRAPLGPAGSSGERDKVQVCIPVELIGRDRDLLDWQIAAITIVPEHGEGWTQRWNWSLRGANRLGLDWLELSLNPEVFEKLNRGPASVHAVVGVIVYEQQMSTKVRGRDVWTPVPGVGFAMLRFEPGPMLWWRVPISYPSQKFVYSLRSRDSANLSRGEWSGNYPSGDILAQINPVISFATSFSTNPQAMAGDVEGDFVVVRPIDLIRRDLEIANIRLGDYVVRQP
jgi:hypothetical protein